MERLLSTVLESDLSQEVKRYLIPRIEDIIRAVHRYTTDGTEGLEKAVKLLVTDLALENHNLEDKDKRNPTYVRVKAFALSLSACLTTMIGVVPDISEFWIPKFHMLAENTQEIERIISESSNTQDIFEKASDIFKREEIKEISGRDMKALPPAKEEGDKATESETNSESNEDER